jgi:hypothetical protein
MLKQPPTWGALLTAVLLIIFVALYDFVRGASLLVFVPEAISWGKNGWDLARANLDSWQGGLLGLALAVPASSVFAYQVIAWKQAGRELTWWAVTPSVPCFFIGVALVLAPGFQDHPKSAQLPPPAPKGSGKGDQEGQIRPKPKHRKKSQDRSKQQQDSNSATEAVAETSAEAPVASSSSSEGSESTGGKYCGCGSYGGSTSPSYEGGSSTTESNPAPVEEPEEEPWEEEPEEPWEEEPEEEWEF